MINRSKVLEFFDADEVREDINIVGCGAIGSHIAEQLIRMGVSKIHLWDFDNVEAHNITNQMFILEDIGMSKVEAVERYLKAINPEVNVIKHEKGLQEPFVLNIFLCVDNIELRKKIVTANRFNPNCKCFMDFRMRLTDAQHYMAVTRDQDKVKALLETMNFTHEEATSATPKSACGTELSVIFTVKAITACGIANWVNWILGKKYQRMVLVDMNFLAIDTIE